MPSKAGMTRPMVTGGPTADVTITAAVQRFLSDAAARDLSEAALKDIECSCRADGRPRKRLRRSNSTPGDRLHVPNTVERRHCSRIPRALEGRTAVGRTMAWSSRIFD